MRWDRRIEAGISRDKLANRGLRRPGENRAGVSGSRLETASRRQVDSGTGFRHDEDAVSAFASRSVPLVVLVAARLRRVFVVSPAQVTAGRLG